MSNKYSSNVYYNLGIAHVRKETSDKSELISQIILGEPYKVISKEDKWSQIETLNDNYIGYIDNNQLPLSPINFTKSTSIVCIKNNAFIKIQNNRIALPFGGVLYNDDINTLKIKYNSKDFITPQSSNIKLFESILKKWISVPYLWGGKSTWGADCSGFVQTAFKVLDISLPRDAYQQAEVGKTVSLENSKMGDLAFFKNKEGRIVHVGIILWNKGKVSIIHASGMVKIEHLDEKGIFNKEKKKYSHELAFIKNII